MSLEPPPRGYNNHCTLFTLTGITPDELIKIYEEEKSIPRTARRIGCSNWSITKYLKMYGCKTIGHRPKGKPVGRIARYPSAVDRWLKDNPGKRLPSDVKEAAKMVGIKPVSMYEWLNVRRVRICEYLQSFGDLKEMDLLLSTEDGRNVRKRFFDSYEYKLDQFYRKLTLIANIRGLEIKFYYPVKVFIEKLTSHQSHNQTEKTDESPLPSQSAPESPEESHPNPHPQQKDSQLLLDLE